MTTEKGVWNFKIKKMTLAMLLVMPMFLLLSFGAGYFASPSHSSVTTTVFSTTTVKVITSLDGNYNFYPVTTSTGYFSINDIFLILAIGAILIVTLSARGPR